MEIAASDGSRFFFFFFLLGIHLGPVRTGISLTSQSAAGKGLMQARELHGCAMHFHDHSTPLRSKRNLHAKKDEL
ncbi:hypothetical protein IWX91DRAFT_336204 [Phyllosticta citricarpa]